MPRFKDKVHLLYEATPSRLGEIGVSQYIQKQTQRIMQKEEREDYVLNKRIRENLKKKTLNEIEIST